MAGATANPSIGHYTGTPGFFVVHCRHQPAKVTVGASLPDSCRPGCRGASPRGCPAPGRALPVIYKARPQRRGARTELRGRQESRSPLNELNDVRRPSAQIWHPLRHTGEFSKSQRATRLRFRRGRQQSCRGNANRYNAHGRGGTVIRKRPRPAPPATLKRVNAGATTRNGNERTDKKPKWGDTRSTPDFVCVATNYQNGA